MRVDDALNGSVETARLRAVAATDHARETSELENARGQHDPQKAAAAFESLLARMLVKELRRGLGEGFFGEGPGADVYGGWLDEHLGASLAKSGALGVAGMVKAALGAPSEQGEPGEADSGAARDGRPGVEPSTETRTKGAHGLRPNRAEER